MEYKEAGLPRTLLDKFNSAGVFVTSKVEGNEKQYLLTRQEYEFYEDSKSVKKGSKIGIGVAFPIDTQTSEVGRVLTFAITKMEEPFVDEVYRMFVYKE